MQVFIIKEYIKWLFRSKTRYSIHSPFVYKLVTECLNDKSQYPEYEIFRSYRKFLKKNNKIIHVVDLGSPSRFFKGHERPVKKLLQVSSASFKEMKLWFRLVRYFHSKNILELGTHLGVSTMALAKGTSGKVISVEGNKELAMFAQENLMRFGIQNVQIVQADFESFLKKNLRKWDLVFIDGNHTFETTVQYFEMLKKQVHNDSVLIFHDIHLSKEMKTAWQRIVSDQDVRVSIDLFCCGLVFFRKEQAKEHFIIRF